MMTENERIAAETRSIMKAVAPKAEEKKPAQKQTKKSKEAK